jgi:hypothetical protein
MCSPLSQWPLFEEFVLLGPVSGNGPFAQLTYPESLRDIEACLGSSKAARCTTGGFRTSMAPSTPVDANESRDWRNLRRLCPSLDRRSSAVACVQCYGRRSILKPLCSRLLTGQLYMPQSPALDKLLVI